MVCRFHEVGRHILVMPSEFVIPSEARNLGVTSCWLVKS